MRVGLKEGGWVGATTETEERKGQEAGAGPSGEGDRRKEAGLRGKETPEPGTKGSKSDRRIEAIRNRWLRGVGEPGEGLGGGTEREGEAGREPPRTEGPHWGRCGEAAAGSQEWGSRALTALLPQEHQLEFPQRIPEVSARGHDGAGGATAASAQRPRGPTLLRAVDEKGGCRALSAPAGPGGGARLGQGSSSEATVAAASPRSRLAPSEARGWVEKEGGIGSQRWARGSQG